MAKSLCAAQVPLCLLAHCYIQQEQHGATSALLRCSCKPECAWLGTELGDFIRGNEQNNIV